MIKVAVTGAAGRMGSGIVRKITEQDDMEVVAAIEIPNTPLEGKDIGLVKCPNCGEMIRPHRACDRALLYLRERILLAEDL